MDKLNTNPMKTFQNQQWSYYKTHTMNFKFTTSTAKLPIGKILKHESQKVTRKLERLRCNFGNFEEFLTLIKQDPKVCICGKKTLTRNHIMQECEIFGNTLKNHSPENLLFKEEGIQILIEQLKQHRIKI
ncbi:unnamed protein product [Ambrosiozyma monospora]|uniref:Unnamed protein product n=1 Tax=Ambrosiozyma monospora TaxID=43982 RepID=A0A9W6WEN9_AMBMO|nr:unnamed protein product [Ambrosiozyma monospora]